MYASILSDLVQIYQASGAPLTIHATAAKMEGIATSGDTANSSIHLLSRIAPPPYVIPKPEK